MSKAYTIALLGQPNSGKSTLFNGLTGARQRVGNWPGKTVEKREGTFTRSGTQYIVTDLPGSYSLSAASEEEIVTRDYIADGGADLVCILVDASQLERSLYMLADYAGIDTPAILLLNMVDVAKDRGKQIDTKKLEERLGIPVVPFIASDRKGYDSFYTAVESSVKYKKTLAVDSITKLYKTLGEKVEKLQKIIPSNGLGQYSAMWLTAKALEGDAPAIEKVMSALPLDSKTKLNSILSDIKDGNLLTGDVKFQWIDQILKGAVSTSKKDTVVLTKFDRAATSRRWGKVIAVGVALLGLVCSMIVAAPIMSFSYIIPYLLAPALTNLLVSLGVTPFLLSLVVNGFLNALFMSIAMTGFVFGITFVFGLIEEVGYMARISYAFDDTMSKIGLQGKAVMPFIISLGCTIGGATSTRVIDSWGQRILTMALAWAVPCGAIFVIIPTLATMFFGWGSILVMLGIFIVTGLHMYITAKVFGRKLSPEADRHGMIMELPPYHKPKWGSLLRYTIQRVISIFFKAFKIIFAMSIIFFILSYSSDGNAENSIIYRIGSFIEPVTQFFGLGWQTFMAFMASAISKEAVMGVLAALFTGTGSVMPSAMTITIGEPVGLSAALTSAISRPEALAFIFAVSFNIPCLQALAATYQENHSAKWTAIIAGYYMATALVIAFVVYHISSLFM